VNGDIVILAVYYSALKDIHREYGDKLAGKVVVDITNPVTSRRSTRWLLPPAAQPLKSWRLPCPRPGC
jgi:8-hydroxy-5-deazaflavin:NADPH oxidoreductase